MVRQRQQPQQIAHQVDTHVDRHALAGLGLRHCVLARYAFDLRLGGQPAGQRLAVRCNSGAGSPQCSPRCSPSVPNVCSVPIAVSPAAWAMLRPSLSTTSISVESLTR